MQRLVVKVDQKGTEAAAATGIGGILTSAQIGPAQPLVLNRPYLLVIQDTKTGTPLLLSRVVDPTGNRGAGASLARQRPTFWRGNRSTRLPTIPRRRSRSKALPSV